MPTQDRNNDKANTTEQVGMRELERWYGLNACFNDEVSVRCSLELLN